MKNLFYLILFIIITGIIIYSFKKYYTRATLLMYGVKVKAVAANTDMLSSGDESTELYQYYYFNWQGTVYKGEYRIFDWPAVRKGDSLDVLLLPDEPEIYEIEGIAGKSWPRKIAAWRRAF